LVRLYAPRKDGGGLDYFGATLAKTEACSIDGLFRRYARKGGGGGV